jgi:hypothetical protein
MIPIRLQVSAPDTSFRPDDADKVEVGIDETGDGTIDDKLTSYADRKYTLAVKEIGSEGRIAIETGVTDLEFELLSPPLNKRAKLVARLSLHDRASISDSVEVVFDRSAPTVEVEPREPIVHRGETVKLSVTALDRDPTGAGSGVKPSTMRPTSEARRPGRRSKSKRRSIPESSCWCSAARTCGDAHFTVLGQRQRRLGEQTRFGDVGSDKRPPNSPTGGPSGPDRHIRADRMVNPVANATVSIVRGRARPIVRVVQKRRQRSVAVRTAPGEYSVAAQGQEQPAKGPPAPGFHSNAAKVVNHNVKLQ